MKCLVCGEILERQNSWEHIRSVHLEPIGVTQERLFEHALKVALPIEVKTAYVTCVSPKDEVIYFSLDNAELLIAFSSEHSKIPWQQVVEWQILHEKGHLACRDLYEAPRLARPHVVMNAEDYYINKYFIQDKYWPVCELNARCSMEIRNISPLPHELRDTHYYCTLATFIAYDAVVPENCSFLNHQEAYFIEKISKSYRKIKRIEDIPLVSREVDEAFRSLGPFGTSSQ
jgi:hypothetical protein